MWEAQTNGVGKRKTTPEEGGLQIVPPRQPVLKVVCNLPFRTGRFISPSCLVEIWIPCCWWKNICRLTRTTFPSFMALCGQREKSGKLFGQLTPRPRVLTMFSWLWKGLFVKQESHCLTLLWCHLVIKWLFYAKQSVRQTAGLHLYNITGCWVSFAYI